ncbi:MAG: hypothetical protein KME11_03100 [Timaviella obliquedivisa GSE-PSE-MK23-08B]|jgi:hypothetical protein|nr:hypothetical protein [Timaviella obliquedivisa GSE-PSE-MK23-08B]MBW4514195.1 hypothetical protein [Timaviella obliquedivisa GSE-PSE-MK23-08B]
MSDLWTLLGTNTRRAIKRRRSRFGRSYTYNPRGDLLQRLSEETGQSREQVYQQLLDIRQDLLRNSS